MLKNFVPLIASQKIVEDLKLTPAHSKVEVMVKYPGSPNVRTHFHPLNVDF